MFFGAQKDAPLQNIRSLFSPFLTKKELNNENNFIKKLFFLSKIIINMLRFFRVKWINKIFTKKMFLIFSILVVNFVRSNAILLITIGCHSLSVQTWFPVNVWVVFTSTICSTTQGSTRCFV